MLPLTVDKSAGCRAELRQQAVVRVHSSMAGLLLAAAAVESSSTATTLGRAVTTTDQYLIHVRVMYSGSLASRAGALRLVEQDCLVSDFDCPDFDPLLA
jgi:hypothetical protein